MNPAFFDESMSSVQPPLSRRRFLKQTVAFSAAALLGDSLLACDGSAVSTTANAADTYEAGSANLLMVGDWGADNGIANQASVAAGMQAFLKRRDLTPQALWMLGDNFYGALKDTSDSRWQTQFEQMYPESIFNCPAYAIPGNHDYQVLPVAKYPIELAYAKQAKTRWTMPSQWYSFQFPLVDPVMRVIALDSNMPYANGTTTHESYYTMTDTQRQQQVTYLEEQLAAPTTLPFTIVMGHHPLYSNGPHGDHATLIQDWDPLFRKYNVHVYVAGHDHDMQHLEFAGHPTSFFCSGGGGADLYNLKVQETQRGPYSQKVFGFSHLSATSSRLTLRHLDASGNLLHSFQKSADGSVTILYQR